MPPRMLSVSIQSYRNAVATYSTHDTTMEPRNSKSWLFTSMTSRMVAVRK